MFHRISLFHRNFQNMANISIKFYLNRQKANPTTGTLPIYCRLIVERQKKEFRLPKTFDLKPAEEYLWNEMSQRLNTRKSPTNDYLNHLELTFQRELTFSEGITLEKLAEKLQQSSEESKSPKVPTIIEYFDDYLAEEIETPIRTEGTKKNYRNAFRQLKNYLRLNKLDRLKINEFTFKEANGFKLYLEKELDPTVKKGELSKKVANKEVSSSTKIKNVKPVFSKAVLEGFLKSNPFGKIRLNHRSQKGPHLTSFEIRKLYKLSLNNRGELHLIRDIYLFMIYTGLSWTDAITMTTRDIRETNGGRLGLIDSRDKTGCPYRQIIIRPAEAIIKKYSSQNRISRDERIFPTISNVDFNRKLKLLGSIADIPVNLTTKTARNTCREQIFEAGIRESLLISTYMGWSPRNDEKVKMQYLGITEQKLLQFSCELEIQLHNVVHEMLPEENEVILKANSLTW